MFDIYNKSPEPKPNNDKKSELKSDEKLKTDPFTLTDESKLNIFYANIASNCNRLSQGRK